MRLKQEQRFISDSYSVVTSDYTPVLQLPPQRGCLMVQSHTEEVPLTNQGKGPGGYLFGVSNSDADKFLQNDSRHANVDEVAAKPKGVHRPTCCITESHSPDVLEPDISNRQFPEEGIKSVISSVSFGVQIDGGGRYQAKLLGPRMIHIKDSKKLEDGRQTAELEIVAMNLMGFDQEGAMITVRGGSRYGLPPVTGSITAISNEAHFPALIEFGITIEISYWGSA